MKPDKNTCLNCGLQISARAKFCSDRCRMAYGRNPNKPEQNVSPNKGEQKTTRTVEPEQNDFRANLTKTDQTFYDRAIDVWGEPYYKFGEAARETICGFCGKPFKTSLSLLKYCSYDHYHDSLVGAK